MGAATGGAEYFLPPAGGGFRVLPATKACLQGFYEFLRCYRGATEVLPKPGQSRGWSRSAVDKHRGVFLFFIAFGVRKGSDWFGRVRKASDQILQEETEQTKGKATEMFSPPA